MSLTISMYVDRACLRAGSAYPVNCMAVVSNSSSSPVTVVSFTINRGPANGTQSRNVPIGAPYANSTIPGNGSVAFTWDESFLTITPPVAGQPSLPFTVGCSCQTSDGSVANSPNATVNVYSIQPPQVPSLTGGSSFGTPPGQNTPQTPVIGQAWFEDTPQSNLVGMMGGH
jgi:hypothetical protein